MASSWLVAVDDSIWTAYAFNLATSWMNKELDHLYLMHVTEVPTKAYAGYASQYLLENLRQVEDEKAKKILVHYGKKSQVLGIEFTMVKGNGPDPGHLLCKAVHEYVYILAYFFSHELRILLMWS
eukprot:TRINITY_DN6347_c0_g1_i7.p1 TRINITY_DN6347_c0_g1~~TRINITY_DN6347_c0_g1_i7.p1  ORF type:complete len:125 (-),score=9.14 TRINITY_DN6347_c0_g1_i7:374-748(-)